MKNKTRWMMILIFVACQVVAISLLFPSPVSAHDCLSDIFNAADCMRTGGFRQGTAILVSLAATITTVLVNILSNLGSGPQPPEPPPTKIYGNGTPDDPYRDGSAFKIGPGGKIERYPESEGKPLDIFGTGTASDPYRNNPPTSEAAATGGAVIPPVAASPNQAAAPAQPAQTGSTMPALQDPAAEVNTYPVPADGHDRIAQDLRNSIPPEVLDNLTKQGWEDLDEDKQKEVATVLAAAYAKELGVGGFKLIFTKDPNYDYGGAADNTKVPPEITLNQWNPFWWNPSRLADSLAHEMRHLQQENPVIPMETEDVKKLALWNYQNFTMPEKDFSAYESQFMERDSRSVGGKVSHALLTQAYEQKLAKIEKFFKTEVLSYRMPSDRFDQIMDQHPECRARMKQLLNEGKIQIVEMPTLEI